MPPLNPAEATAPPAGALAPPFELVCPAGSLAALKAAVDNGANCVYLGLRDATNARNFAGLNFDEAAIASGIAYAHQRGCKVFMALNTYPQAANPGPWRSALDKAAIELPVFDPRQVPEQVDADQQVQPLQALKPITGIETHLSPLQLTHLRNKVAVCSDRDRRRRLSAAAVVLSAPCQRGRQGAVAGLCVCVCAVLSSPPPSSTGARGSICSTACEPPPMATKSAFCLAATGAAAFRR